MGEADPPATHTFLTAKSQTGGHSNGCHFMSTSRIHLCSFSAYYVPEQAIPSYCHSPSQQHSLLFRDEDTGSERLGNSLRVTQPGRQFESACALWRASIIAALPTHVPSEGGQVCWGGAKAGEVT